MGVTLFWKTLLASFALAGALLSFPLQSSLQEYRVESALVTVPVLVMDSQGRFISGLGTDSFKLFQDGLPERISLFLSAEDPLKIALLIDTSVSTATVLGKIKKAAGRFLLQMRPQDMAMVVSFDSDVQILCPFSSERRELEDTIRKTRPGGSNTRMRDAIVEIAEKRFRSISGRKAIVLLTDGQDHGSQTSAQELLDSVMASGTPIYSVFYTVDPRALTKELFGVSTRLPASSKKRGGGAASVWEEQEEEAAKRLEQMSELSSGRFYRSKIAELGQAFGRISQELRSQYLLGFYPERSKLDGKQHRLVVGVSVPGAVVRNRNGYRSRE
jgi:Ca-activated chloride channel homolog